MRWLICILLLCFMQRSYAQNKKNEYKRLIDSAITIHATQFYELSQKQAPNNYVIENLYLLNEEDYPYEVAGKTKINFKTINISTKAAKRMIKKIGINAWRVSGLLIGNKLFVNIQSLFISMQNNKYNFSVGGGGQTIFEYSCVSNNWILIESKSFGI